MTCAVIRDQKDVDRAESAADVQHPCTAQVHALKQACDLGGSARRQKAIAPDDLQQSLHAVVVLPGFSRPVYLDRHCRS